MNKILIAVIALIVIGGVWWWIQSPKPEEKMTGPENVSDSSTQPSDKTSNETVVSEKTVKEFSLTGVPFKFSLSEIKVKKGDTVKITFKNESGVHSWNLDEFGAATEVLQAGQQETIEFVADKTGTFEYYCSVSNHRQMGMKGAFIVEE